MQKETNKSKFILTAKEEREHKIEDTKHNYSSIQYFLQQSLPIVNYEKDMVSQLYNCIFNHMEILFIPLTDMWAENDLKSYSIQCHVHFSIRNQIAHIPDVLFTNCRCFKQ